MPASKTAIITGGASGIGLAVGEHLVRTGWNVTIFDLHASDGIHIAENLGSQVMFVGGDVTIYADQLKAFLETWKAWGQIDLVFANAGITDKVDFCQPQIDITDDAPKQPETSVIDIDLGGILWSSHIALHYFRKNPSKSGKLIMTASSAGLYPLSEAPLYSTAKAGVIGLARSLAKRMQDLSEAITINAICPGLVPTNIVSKDLLAAVPEDIITPLSVVIQAIDSVISDSSITGQAIECNGQQVEARPVLPYLNKAAQYTAGGGYKSDIDSSKVFT